MADVDSRDRNGLPGGSGAPLPGATAPPAPDVVPPPEERSVWADVRMLLAALGGAPHGRTIKALALAILAVLAANMVGQVALNRWQGAFFDAIERKDTAQLGAQLLLFVGIAGALLALVVAQTWLHEVLKIRAREWLTLRLFDDWLVPGRAYRLAVSATAGVNPDQRMQEDARRVTEIAVNLVVGISQHLLLLVTFVGVLWSLSRSMTFVMWGHAVEIPGYMVWCAVAYSTAGSLLTWLVGRPLIQLNVERYSREAELRFSLMRVSERAEAIALSGGEVDERRILDRALGEVLVATRRIAFGLARLTWITSGYGWLAIVVPVLVALPSYLAGALTLGGLMRVVDAFRQVQEALRWFVDNFTHIADWRAALHRVMVFHDALQVLDDVEPGTEQIEIAEHPHGLLGFENVSVLLADGRVVIAEATATIRRGERVLLKGESGSGKSTLFRAIAGLWPWGSGRILVPPRSEMMFVPQRPYLPLGTLRAAVTYPAAPQTFDDAAVDAALVRVGLQDLLPRLDRAERWDRWLSLGEQQRVAFARLLVHAPRWVFLDEATAALDPESEARVMSVFEDVLAASTVLSIGHRPSLERFHHRTLHLVANPDGARLRRRSHAPLSSGWLARLRDVVRRGRRGRRGTVRPTARPR